MRRRNLPEKRHCDAGTLAMARMPRLRVLRQHGGAELPLPVPPPAAVITPRPPYRTCEPCGVGWRGYGPCWSPTHQEGASHG